MISVMGPFGGVGVRRKFLTKYILFSIISPQLGPLAKGSVLCDAL